MGSLTQLGCLVSREKVPYSKGMMDKRENYIEEKYAAYASPAMDACYKAHSQIKSSAVQNPVMYTVCILLLVCAIIILTSCAIKTSPRNWFKITACIAVIVAIYILSVKACTISSVE